MTYFGISVQIIRDSYILQVAANDYGRKKDALQSRTSVTLDIFGIPVVDPTFIFELRAILEEFIGRRLGSYTSKDLLNTNLIPFNTEQELNIFRDADTLVLLVKNYPTKSEWIKKWNMIQAKTLYSIVHKAIQQITVLEDYYG